MKCFASIILLFSGFISNAQHTQKPPLHGKNWMAITGKPLAATGGRYDISEKEAMQ